MLAFSPLLPAVAGRNALAFLAVLPLLWAALRRGQKDTALAALILSIFAVWGVAAGRGPFVQSTENESFLLVIAFVVSTTLPSLALSAAVTSRNRLLKQTQEELYQSQKLEALGQLTGGVAHDFNNLLMVISSGLRLLDRPDALNRRVEIIKSMQQAVDRGATLIRQLLAFARREALHPELVDLPRRIKEMEELLRRTLGLNIQIELNVALGLWPVNVDPTGLELALINLAVNARDAMPLGGKLTIEVRNLTTEQNSDGFVAIIASDTGVGMSPEVRLRAVEPFFTTKGPGRGTSLGLSQVFGFITQSGGTVQIESEIGRGTRITLTLPKAADPRPADRAYHGLCRTCRKRRHGVLCPSQTLWTRAVETNPCESSPTDFALSSFHAAPDWQRRSDASPAHTVYTPGRGTSQNRTSASQVFLLIGPRRQYGVAGTWNYHCPLSRHTSFPRLDVADLLEFGHACEGGRMRKVRRIREQAICEPKEGCDCENNEPCAE